MSDVKRPGMHRRDGQDLNGFEAGECSDADAGTSSICPIQRRSTKTRRVEHEEKRSTGSLSTGTETNIRGGVARLK
ncbi:uncharacterized protein N7503_008384 [Penicillium pulvis]|uniref:uncharacterized protein n=1 Tax=Penicillium pulvis TaxID=1562058 RepID=UPI002548B2EE|nr:uncharacterized protein N7503_008384 [Penicillium pulvis]KAJ5792406.1 hypothetical protein N7503_008384 [Penicillium pulvis]